MNLIRYLQPSLLGEPFLPTMLAFTRMYSPKYIRWIEQRRRRLKTGPTKHDRPECMEDPCGLEPLPMDLDHYTPSDKGARKYQRTWCEFYPIPSPIVKREKQYLKVPRRKLRKMRSEMVKCREKDLFPIRKNLKPEKLMDLPCGGIEYPWPCCKITAPGCETGRRPPDCPPRDLASCCKKRRTQYPSFSECIKERLLGPYRPCECELKASICEAFAHWRRLEEKKY
ncbi:hypothetical protein KR018_006579 [Drosophila ironensis]|nr:hypothetical protein KR018_006579 [Drosophila ironensis]